MPDYYWRLWRPVIGRHIFGASARPRSLTKNTGYVTLFHCSWRSAWYQLPGMWRSSCNCLRHSWLTKFGVLCLNQLVWSYFTSTYGRMLQIVRDTHEGADPTPSWYHPVMSPPNWPFCCRYIISRRQGPLGNFIPRDVPGPPKSGVSTKRPHLNGMQYFKPVIFKSMQYLKPIILKSIQYLKRLYLSRYNP